MKLPGRKESSERSYDDLSVRLNFIRGKHGLIPLPKDYLSTLTPTEVRDMINRGIQGEFAAEAKVLRGDSDSLDYQKKEGF